MKIVRDGKEIELTQDEVREVVRKEHENDVRYEIENSLSVYEEDGVISFENWQDCTLAEYSSLEDARSDFVECILEHLLDLEDTDERNPLRSPCSHDYDSEVYDTAKDFGFLKGEE